MNAFKQLNTHNISGRPFAKWSPKTLKAAYIAREENMLPPEALAYIKEHNVTIHEMRSFWIQEAESRSGGAKYNLGGYWATALSEEPVEVREVTAEQKTAGKTATLSFPVEGKAVDIKITPIPYMPGEVVRKGLDFILPLLHPFYKVEGGRLVLSMNDQEWVKPCQNSIFKASGFSRLVPILAEIVQPGIDSLTSFQLSSLTGHRWIQFLKEQLMYCSLPDYIALHSGIVEYCIKEKADASYYYSEIGAKTDEKFAEIRKTLGKVTPKLITSPAQTGDVPSLLYVEKAGQNKGTALEFSRAMAAVQGLATILGKSTEGVMLMARTRNFTSMMTKSECDCVYVVSTVLGLLSQGKKVMVQLTSTSLLDPVWNSFQTWVTRSKAKVPNANLKFLTPRSLLLNISSNYLDHCETTLKEGYTLVWDCQRPVSSESEMKSKLAESTKVLAEFQTYGSFVVRTAIYGHLVPTSTDKHHIYQFSDGSQFQGVISSEPNVSMMAYNAERGYYLKPLSVATEENWYSYVTASCGLVLAMPFRAQVYASEICNVVTVDKTRFRVNRMYDGTLELETLSPETMLEVRGQWELQRDPEPVSSDGEDYGDEDDAEGTDNDDEGAQTTYVRKDYGSESVVTTTTTDTTALTTTTTTTTPGKSHRKRPPKPKKDERDTKKSTQISTVDLDELM